MGGGTPLALAVEELSQEAYRAYGDVVQSGGGPAPAVACNGGTAMRSNFVAGLSNLRDGARPNVAVFRTEPRPERPIRQAVVERHAFSTQMFIPMTVSRYLVVVALPDRAKEGAPPDWGTLRAFLARRDQGVTYHAGTWHAPMITLDAAADFAMLVWEDGSAGDCEVVPIEGGPISISIPAAE